MSHFWLSLLPAVLVLLLASIMRKGVTIPLIIGIIVAGFISSSYSLQKTFFLVLGRLAKTTGIPAFLTQAGDFDNLYIYIFLLTLGILIELMTHSGGIEACTALLTRSIHSKKRAESTSLLFSCCFFLDDYLNSLIVGHSMRPLMDRLGVCREKLAFLLNSVCSSLCLLIPASSWIAFIVPQLESNGISLTIANNPYIIADPFSVYIHVIPYLVFPLLSIISAWIIVRWRISFGPMQKYEKKAHAHAIHLTTTKGSSSDVIIPLGIFMITLAISIMYQGNWHVFGGMHLFSRALHKGLSAIFISLCIASCISTSSTALYYWLRGMPIASLVRSSIKGIQLMKGAVILLILAWTFSSIMKDDLKTGHLLAQALHQSIPASIICAALFVITTSITMAIGSSWGTISIMLPLAMALISSLTQTPATLDHIPLLLPALGALFSGAVAGSQLSPITDASIMASTAAGANVVRHSRSQAVYALPNIIATTLAFSCISLAAQQSYVPVYVIVLAIALSSMILLMTLMSYLLKQQKSS